MRLVSPVLVAIVALAIAAGAAWGYPSDPKTGVTILDESRVEPGYVLYTPLLGDPSQGTATVTYLINVYGEVVHIWPQDVGAGQYASLLPDGRLFFAGQSEKEIDVPAGDGGLLQIMDWDGNVEWSYENDFLHHDQQLLPDGNVAALIYSKVPDEMVPQVQGGLPGTELEDGSMWGDSIIEIDQDGNIVNQIDVWQYLDPAQDAIHPDLNRIEWTHANSLFYVESDPITNSEAYLVSHRQISTVALVDRATGNLIWKWGPGEISHQHDARLLANGNVLVYDNGEDPVDPPDGHFVPRSRVVEVDPRTNEVVWTYVAPGITSWRFFSPLISGAHRTPNGNTFITEGMPGRLFEVTPEGETVWEYITPHGRPITDQDGEPIEGPAMESWIFRATKYTADQVAFPDDLPGPMERLSPADEVPAPTESAPEDVDMQVAAADDGLQWWHGLLIGVVATAAVFGAGYGVSVLNRRT